MFQRYFTYSDATGESRNIGDNEGCRYALALEGAEKIDRST